MTTNSIDDINNVSKNNINNNNNNNSNTITMTNNSLKPLREFESELRSRFAFRLLTP